MAAGERGKRLPPSLDGAPAFEHDQILAEPPQLSDARDPASTTHSYADMIGARMFAIACGYEDCDDLDVLRFDPAFKLACGRLPERGRDLMSQPTLSRLENAPSWRELARMGLTMIDLFCDSFERVPQRIVLDIDDTPDAVHGGQQLALFNAHYDEYLAATLVGQREGEDIRMREERIARLLDDPKKLQELRQQRAERKAERQQHKGRYQSWGMRL